MEPENSLPCLQEPARNSGALYKNS